MNKKIKTFVFLTIIYVLVVPFYSCEHEDVVFDEEVTDVLIQDSIVTIPDSIFTGDDISVPDGDILVPENIWNIQRFSTSDFAGVYFLNKDVGYICGSNGIIITTENGGRSYRNLNSGTEQYLYDLYFINSEIGFAVGNNNTFIKTTNGGKSWSAVSTPVYSDYRSIYFVNSNTGFVLGSDGVIVKTENGGGSWKKVFSGTYGNGVYGMHFTDNKIGYASGRGGMVLKTINGGDTWSYLSVNGLNEQDLLTSIYFTDKNNGFVVGGDPRSFGNRKSILLRTQDAGSNWTKVQLPSALDYDYLASVKFYNDKIGFITGGNIINNTSSVLKTIDGGSTWTLESVSSKRQYRLFITEEDVYSVGMSGTILKGSR